MGNVVGRGCKSFNSAISNNFNLLLCLCFLQTGWNIRDLLRSLTTFLITLADEIAITFERGPVKNDP